MSKLLSYSKIAGYHKCPASTYASETAKSEVITKVALHRLGLPFDVDLSLLERTATEATAYGQVGHMLTQEKLTFNRETEDTEMFIDMYFQEYNDIIRTPKKKNIKKKFLDLDFVTDNMVAALDEREGNDIYNGKVEEHWTVDNVHGFIDYILPSGKIVDFKFLSEIETPDGYDWWVAYELQAQIYAWMNFRLNGTLQPVLYEAYIKKTKDIVFHEFIYDMMDMAVIEEMLEAEARDIQKQRTSDFLWRCDHPFCQYCKKTRDLVYSFHLTN